MSGKIEISREQLERWQKTALQWGIDSIGVEIMHALAAPVVERQPVVMYPRCTILKECSVRTSSSTECKASPLAPVADDLVRLLTRARIYARGEFRDEIEACLKELNQ